MKSGYLPTTRALQTFEAAARLGAFSAAARELNLTQGAVSHQIGELEKLLDCKLFDRRGRNVVLNQTGETYLNYARDALQALRLGAQAVEPVGANTRTLTVSVSPNFAAKWLVPRLGEFLEAHPDIDLRISAAMRHIDFATDDVDLAVRHGTGDWPDLHVTKLSDEWIFPVVSPMLLGKTKINKPEQLKAFTLLHDQSVDKWQEWFEQFDIESNDEGPVFDQTAYAIDAAVAGQGIALARSQLVSLDVDANRLVAPLKQRTKAPFSYWIVRPVASPKEDSITRFSDWLVSAATPH